MAARLDGSDRNRQSDSRRARRNVDGVLLLDKPPGQTSNRILQIVKRMYQARKAGHTGSLDPLASGMLPICFGQATKLSTYMLGADKVYRVTAEFGARTDTADADGKVIANSPITEVTREALETSLQRFRGEIQQIPPMYSALKVGGRRLYKLAREGRDVPREPRTVRIHSLELNAYDPRRPEFHVRCSKGTYIRTLVEDIAAAVGTLGHVITLRRLSVAPFAEEDLVTLEELQSADRRGVEALDAFLRPADEAIAGWPAVCLNKAESDYLLQGHAVNTGVDQDAGLVRLYGEAGAFLGIGEVLPDGRVRPKRLFV